MSTIRKFKGKKGGDKPHFDRIPEALLNEDILRLILEHFDLQPGSPTAAQTRKDLLSVAKSCKVFSGPALSSLWCILPSLLPLLLLLPSAEVSGNYYFVDRLPLGNNWERFDMHAPRVRTLYMERVRIVISPHVYLRIRSLRHPNTPLLPGLKNIYIPDNTSLDFSSALLLASESSLNSIQLENSATSDRQFFNPFLFLLSVNSPNLTHLSLSGTANTSLELLPSFESLQRLELKLSGTYLSTHILRNLGKLDNLLDMTLDTSPSIQAPTERSDLAPPSTDSTFIKLKKLRILGTPMSISRVLSEINVLTNLITLIIHETTNDPRNNTESSWDHCFSIISRFPTIENIEVTQSEGSSRHGGHPTRDYSLSTSCFYFLRLLENLKSFVINDFIISGSDHDFRCLACCFPKLKKFVEPCANTRREGH